MTTEATYNEQFFVKAALTSWDQWINRTSKLFDSLTDEQMFAEVAPGKNRAIYLIAVNDAIVPQLRLGEPRYPAYRETFITQPDRAVADLPPIAELRQNWKDLNLRLNTLFRELTLTQWLERHSAISEEDFVKEPHRNRLAILFSRTNHTSYHLGQLLLIGK